MNWGPSYEKQILKKSHNAKQLKGGTLWNFSTFILLQDSEKLKGGGCPLVKKNSRKGLAMAKKPVLPDIVCYAGNLFGSVPWAIGYNLASSYNFVERLG